MRTSERIDTSATFAADAQLGTWLTRIVNQPGADAAAKTEARPGRGAFRSEHDQTGQQPEADDWRISERNRRPRATLRAEIRRMLERRIDELPVAFRTVFVMREVEDMTVEETAECSRHPARHRPHPAVPRAGAAARGARARIDTATVDVFGFAGARCDRIVAARAGRVAADPRSSDGLRIPRVPVR